MSLISIANLGYAQQWRLVPSSSGVRIWSIDIFAPSPDTIYAMGDRLIQSVDGGASWAEVSQQYGSDLKIDRSSSKYLFASVPTDGEGDGIAISADAGKTWKLVGYSAGPLRIFVETDPFEQSTIYAGIGPSRLLHSTNRGVTWDTIRIPAEFHQILDLKICPSNHNVMYLSCASNIVKTTDRGLSWQITNGPQGDAELVVDPRSTDIAYAMMQNSNGIEPVGIFKTTDGGSSWTQKNHGLEGRQGLEWNFHAIALNPKIPEEIYLGAFSNKNSILYRSTNGGEEWLPFCSGLPDSSAVGAIAIDTLRAKLFIGVHTFWSTTRGIYVNNIPTGIVREQVAIGIEACVLQLQNYPNPFNNETMFRFSVPFVQSCRIDIFNVLGKQIATLFDGIARSGDNELKIDLREYSSGMYFCTLRTENRIVVKRIMMLKWFSGRELDVRCLTIRSTCRAAVRAVTSAY